MPICIVKGCDNRDRRYGSLMFHRIPTTDKHQHRKTEWLAALGLNPTTPLELLRKWRVCSEHFVSNDYIETTDKVTRLKVRHLKDKAVPSVFPARRQSESAVGAGELGAIGQDLPKEDDSFSLFAGSPQSTPQKCKPTAAAALPVEFKVPIGFPPTSPAKFFRPSAALAPPTWTNLEPQKIERSAMDNMSSELAPDPTDISFASETSPSTSTTGSTTSSSGHPTGWKDRKWIVSESKLMELFQSCHVCGILMSDANLAVSAVGGRIAVIWTCNHDHTGEWESCPTSRQMTDYNLLSAAAATLFTNIADWAELLNLQLPRSETYYAMKRHYRIPVVAEVYKKQEDCVKARLICQTDDGEGVQLCGDGRSDSPGHSGKYTTYSFMDDSSSLIQVSSGNTCHRDPITTLATGHKVILVPGHDNGQSATLNNTLAIGHEPKQLLINDDGQLVMPSSTLATGLKPIRLPGNDDGQSPMPPEEEDEAIIEVIVGQDNEGIDEHRYSYQGEDQSMTRQEPPSGEDKSMTQPKPYRCSDCNLSFTCSLELLRHMRIHTKQNSFQCPNCDCSFAVVRQLKIHMRTHKPAPKSYKCPECEKTFSSSSNLNRHRSKMNDVEPFQCPQCNIVLSRTTCIRYHREKHQVRMYGCSRCGKQFSTAIRLEDHQKLHGEMRYKCLSCPAAFVSPSKLAVHQVRHTGQRTFKCCQCNQSFKRKSSLKNHKRSHADDAGGQLCRCAQCKTLFPPHTRLTSLEKRRHKCSQCGKAFELLVYLRIHQRSHVREKTFARNLQLELHKRSQQKAVRVPHKTTDALWERPYQCALCMKTFAHASELTAHGKSHRKAAPVSRKARRKVPQTDRSESYQCCQCDQTFGHKKGLWVHRKETHADAEPCDCPLCCKIRPHKCSVCGKRFPMLFSLQSHQKSHSEERPYVCAQCGKAFARPVGLRNHERTHSDEKPFVCSECGKRFNFPGDLRKHRMTHIGESPYVCAPCARTFVDAEALRDHQRLHQGRRPFRCSTCGTSFWEELSLTRHQRVHTGAKPYRCKQCGRAFLRISRHRCSAERHQGETQDCAPVSEETQDCAQFSDETEDCAPVSEETRGSTQDFYIKTEDCAQDSNIETKGSALVYEETQNGAQDFYIKTEDDAQD